MRAHAPRPAGPLERGLLQATLLYYWAYLYLRTLLPDTAESTLSYVAAIGPVAAAAVIGLVLRVAANGGRLPWPRATLWLILFAALVALASAWHVDRATLTAAGLLAATALWLASTPATVALSTLNRLLLASVALAALFHGLGWSEYGLLPGQYAEGADRGIAWRVSLFPFVPESGFFALVALLANLLHGQGAARWAYAALAAYFLVFSGMRSALLALLLCIVLILLDRRWRQAEPSRRAAARLLACGALVVVFVGSIVSSAVLALVPGLAEGPLGAYLLRSAADDPSAESIGQSVYRSWLWLQHLEVFAESPWVGAGSYDFAERAGESLIEGHADTGTESFFTQWLSRVGLVFVPFVAFLGVVAARAARARSLLPTAVLLVLGIAGLAYGSFLVPYNFMFLVLFMLLLMPVRPDGAGGAR